MANRWGNMETVTDFIFLGSKITADDDCSHKIKIHLLLEKQAMTNVSSAIQSCLTLCELIDCSTPGFPFLHHLPVCSNSCPLSRWCHPTVSSSLVPSSFHPQSFPPPGSFPVSRFFSLGGQSIGVSASASILPVNIQAWFPLGWTDLISLLFEGLWRVFSSTTTRKHQYLWWWWFSHCITSNN